MVTPRVALAIAVTCIVLCHLPSLSFGFLSWDDDLHVTANPEVTGARPVTWRELLTTPSLGYPIPITIASYALEARLAGPAPWHFHLVNVLLHACNAALLWWLAHRLGLSSTAAVCAVLLFGLHPVVAEPVSWVTGRKDLLATALGLSAVLLGSGSGPMFAAVSCYAAALLCKPTAAPLCLWLLATPSALPLRQRVRGLWPYLLVLQPVLIMGVLGQRALHAITAPERAGAGYTRAAWYALGHHLRLLLGLEETTAKYLPVPWPPGFTPRVDLLPLLAAGVALWSLRFLPSPQRTAAKLGLLWALLAYLPNSNLIPLARYLADSYLYLPLLGCALYVGAVIDALLLRFTNLPRLTQLVLPAALLAACLTPFLRSQARFASDLSLWQQARARYPQNPRLCRQWANAVAHQLGPEPGLSATDDCVSRFGDALFLKNKALLLIALGRDTEARTWLEEAARSHPADPAVQAARAVLRPP